MHHGKQRSRVQRDDGGDTSVLPPTANSVIKESTSVCSPLDAAGEAGLTEETGLPPGDLWYNVKRRANIRKTDNATDNTGAMLAVTEGQGGHPVPREMVWGQEPDHLLEVYCTFNGPIISNYLSSPHRLSPYSACCF